MLLPKKVGTFTLMRRLGSDGVTDSFVGILDEPAGKQVMVHQLAPALVRDVARMAELEKRVADLATVRHPALVPVLELARHGDDAYVLEEWTDAVDLDRVLQYCRENRTTLPHHIFLNIATQICNALEALHGRPAKASGVDHVLHLAVQPSAVLLGSDGKLMLGRYGLQRSPTSVPTGSTSTVIARLEYLSPEQTHPEQGKEKLGPASDIFALGSLLYELLTLEPLFKAESNLQTVHRIRRAEVATPLLRVKEILPGLDKVLYRALSLNPRHRYQRAFVLREDLRGLMSNFSFARIADDTREFLAPMFDGRSPRMVDPIEPPGLPIGVVGDRPEALPVVVEEHTDPVSSDDTAALIKRAEDRGRAPATLVPTDDVVAEALAERPTEEASRAAAGEARPSLPEPLPEAHPAPPQADHTTWISKSALAPEDAPAPKASRKPTPKPDVALGAQTRPDTGRIAPPVDSPTDEKPRATPAPAERKKLSDTAPPPPSHRPPAPVVEGPPVDDDEEDSGQNRWLLLVGGVLGLAVVGVLAVVIGGAVVGSVYLNNDGGVATAPAPVTPVPAPPIAPIAAAPTEAPPAPTEATPAEAVPAPPVAEPVAPVAVAPPPRPEPPPAPKVTPPAPIAVAALTPKPAPRPVTPTPAPKPVEARPAPVATPTPAKTTRPQVLDVAPPKIDSSPVDLGAGVGGVGALAAYSEKAHSGGLSESDRSALAAVGSASADYTRAQVLLYEDAKVRRDSLSARKHLDAVMAVPENQYNPTLLVEQAEIAVHKRDWNTAVERATKAEQNWARLPPELVFSRKAMIYEVQAAGWQGKFYDSGGDDLDALQNAIRAWEKYQRHVETKSRADLKQKADTQLAKLYDMQRRLE